MKILIHSESREDMSEMEDDLSVGDGNDSTDPNHGISYSYARAPTLAILAAYNAHNANSESPEGDPEVKPVRTLE